MNKRMIYQTDDTRQKIFNTALALFTEQGLFDVQMKDIAQKAGVSRNTLYRYYQDKSDLALSIVTTLLRKVFVEYAEAAFKEINTEELNGWQKLKDSFCSIWIDAGFEPEFRFMAEFDSYYSSSRLSQEIIERMKKNIKMDDSSLWAKLVQEGIDDKSIRSDKEPHLLLAILINSVRGLNQRILLRGESLVETNKGELQTMILEFIEILFDGIKA